MIQVRDIFYLKFGKAKEAKENLKEGLNVFKKLGFDPGNIMTDLTGRSYRIVMETRFKDLAELENLLKATFGNAEWGAWYKKMIPLIDSAEREIFTIVEF